MPVSIIMPSYLGPYKTAAKNREEKIVRAIRSVQAQTIEDWELMIIADGCSKTVGIVTEIKDERVKLHYISKQPLWSGRVRNEGIKESSKEWICYLDIDDAFHPDHIKSMQAGFSKDIDWFWTDDYAWSGDEFRHRKCNINKPGSCGTSNIFHRKIALWNDRDNYAHDWNFIKNLKRASNKYEYIRGGKYLVCHIPGRFDI